MILGDGTDGKWYQRLVNRFTLYLFTPPEAMVNGGNWHGK